MKKQLIMLSTILLCVATQAGIIVSDLSYTSDSLTFTMTGDLSGYEEPGGGKDELSISYTGDLGLSTNNTSVGNSWTETPFSIGIASDGLTGSWPNNSLDPYTWCRFNSDLSNETTASGISVTVTFDQGVLNTEATTGEFVFYWGLPSTGTELTHTVIPEPATFGLIAIFGGGIFAVRRIFII
ncbi:MAG: hypothetical protein V5783_10665 [Pontiella sp.]